MGRFLRSEEALERKIQKLREQQELKTQEALARKSREMKRRHLYASMYEPHACVHGTDDDPCPRYAIPGGFFCIRHGGNAPEAREAAKMRILALVEPALKVLNRAMASGDEAIAVKAATVLLDRAGFHPKADLFAADPKEDLTKLSKEDLLERGRKIMNRVMEMNEQKKLLPEIVEQEIPLPLNSEELVDEDEGSIH